MKAGNLYEGGWIKPEPGAHCGHYVFLRGPAEGCATAVYCGLPFNHEGHCTFMVDVGTINHMLAGSRLTVVRRPRRKWSFRKWVLSLDAA
jgi:hypothetical protein